jgi:hypothetical protein
MKKKNLNPKQQKGRGGQGGKGVKAVFCRMKENHCSNLEPVLTSFFSRNICLQPKWWSSLGTFSLI